MITSFEVGAVFRVINEATRPLQAILRQVRELTAAIDKAKANIATLAKMPGLAAATDETKLLAAEWRNVAKAAASASRSIGTASKRALTGPGVAGVAEAEQMASAWERIAAASMAARGGPRLPAPISGGAGGGRGGGGRASLGGRLGMGGGVHVGGPGFHIPGGHINTTGVGMAALGGLGYGVYQAMQYDDATALMATHAGVDLASNRAKFRKMLEDASMVTGYGEHDVSMAAQQELRMFKYTPGEGNGVSALPTMLKLAGTESRLKGTPLEESMEAETGIAHMVGKYSEADVTRLAAAFSAMSVSNPMTLAQQKRAFSYAVPVLQAGMDIDPLDTMASSTALARAGIGSTKAGTWIRQMMKGAMPGTSFMSKMMFKKHETALQELGLVDANDKPTWFVDGKPNELKFLEKVAERLPKIPVERRMAVLGGLAGTQGAGALAVLAEPVVQEQLKKIAADVKDPKSVARMNNFLGEYNRDSSLQNARTTMQTFNVTMAELGTTVLPAVNQALTDFKSVLLAITGILPKSGDGKSTVGARILEGAAGGAVIGTVIPGVGTVAGALGGGVIGGLEGIAEQYMKNHGGSADFSTGNSAARAAIMGTHGGLDFGKPAVKVQPVPNTNLTVNLDGRTLAQSVIEWITKNSMFEIGAPASDGSQVYGP